MDFLTNFFLSGALTVLVWVVGAVYVHFTDPNTFTYIAWLKIWAVTAAVQAIVFSIILGGLFPDPALEGLSGVGGLLGF